MQGWSRKRCQWAQKVASTPTDRLANLGKITCKIDRKSCNSQVDALWHCGNCNQRVIEHGVAYVPETRDSKEPQSCRHGVLGTIYESKERRPPDPHRWAGHLRLKTRKDNLTSKKITLQNKELVASAVKVAEKPRAIAVCGADLGMLGLPAGISTLSGHFVLFGFCLCCLLCPGHVVHCHQVVCNRMWTDSRSRHR